MLWIFVMFEENGNQVHIQEKKFIFHLIELFSVLHGYITFNSMIMLKELQVKVNKFDTYLVCSTNLHSHNTFGSKQPLSLLLLVSLTNELRSGNFFK